MTIPPGSIIGILGGGQLGKMLAVAAAQLGYRCHVFAPEADPPAKGISAEFTHGDYLDTEALKRFAADCDVVTYEFENIATGALGAIADKLRPSLGSLEIGQERALEKEFIEKVEAKAGAWMRIDSEEDARAAERRLSLPLVLKTRRYGYDGKGQAWAMEPGSTVAAWDQIGREPAVAEARVDFDCEFSVILARSADGSTTVWDLPFNEHDNGILRRSTIPAGAAVERHSSEAVRVATAIAEALNHIGVITVEFFATAEGPLVNEIAPRVHNSGHWTIEGAVTSQFEQHIRAICGLPLGPTSRTGAATMENLLGEEVNAWPKLFAEPGAHVHLYGKGEPLPGRKMGHVTRVKL